MSAISTAASGLYAASLQLDVVASNLANSQTTGAVTPNASVTAASATAAFATNTPSPTGSSVAPPLAYQPLQLVQYSNADVAGGGVSANVQPISPAAYAAYGPSSSYAGASGQTAAPDIDLPAQIANQASALIQFQANLKVIETSDQLQKSLVDQSA